MGTLARDGAHWHAFGRANPVVHTDPGGLFGLIDGLLTGLDMADMALGAMQDALNGVMMTAQFNASLESYAANQIFDVDWATDWGASDDWYSSGPAMSGDGGRGLGPAMGVGCYPPGMDWGISRAAHGAGAHDMLARAWAEFYRAKYGPQNVRFNQELVNASGKSVSRLRPDVQVYDRDRNRWIIVEVENSNVRGKQGNGARHRAMAEALGVSESDVLYRTIRRGDAVPNSITRMSRMRPWSRRP